MKAVLLKEPREILRALRDATAALVAVAAFTTLVLLVAGAPPLDAYLQILKGALGSWVKFAHVIQAWIPLTLCACGLLYTFRINLWNIGVEGQMMFGAIFATLVLRLAIDTSGASTAVLLALAAAAVGGAGWALLAGYLKTRGGVNAIFAGLGLNFVAQGIVLWLIFGPWKRPGIASMSGTESFPTHLWLTHLTGLRVSPVSLSCVAAAVALTAILLRYSRFGLNLRAVGGNPQAAFLFGVRTGTHMLLAMTFAGGFAGLAGGLQVVGVYHRLIPSISSNYGYLALLVVMLSGYRVWSTPLVAFFFACLNVGSIQLPMMLQLDSSLSGVIQGALVLGVLGVNAWRERRA